MNIFIVLVGISLIGIGAVLLLIKNEDKPSLRDLGGLPVLTLSSKIGKGTSFFAEFLAKFRKPNAPQSTEQENNSSFLLEVQDFGPKFMGEEPAAKPVELSALEEKKIEKEIELTSQLEEWKAKYERLDDLFKEKSSALEKIDGNLQNELNNRKEFNKLKDILEKEIKDIKEKTRLIQTELTAAKAEADGYKKRIGQLEEKSEGLEKTIIDKDIAITGKDKAIADKDQAIAEKDKAIAQKDEKIAELVKRFETTVENSSNAPAAIEPVPPVIESAPAPIEDNSKDEQK